MWRRTAAIGTATGVVGVLVGWVIGANGDGDSPSPAITVFASDSSPTTAAAPTPAPVTPTPTTTKGTEPSSVQKVRTVGEFEVSATVAGLPYEVVVLSSAGELRTMDLTTGRWVQSEPVDGEQAVAGNGWILVGNGRNADLYRGGSVQASIDVDLSRAWLDPTGDTLCVGDEELGQGRAGTVAELRPDGTASGRTIELPAMPSAIDHTGAFVVNTAAGSQLIGLDGATELSVDPVVALGPTAVISVVCDNGACGYSVIDRTDGQQRRLNLDHDFDVAPVDLGAFVWGEVSPDGRWAIMTITYNETSESGDRATWAQPAAIELDRQDGPPGERVEPIRGAPTLDS